MPKAAVIHEKGGPDVFRYEDVEVGDPGPGEVHLKHTAIGREKGAVAGPLRARERRV